MSGGLLFLTLCALAAAGYLAGYRKAVSVSGGNPRVMHSLLPYHGWNVALATFLPGIAVLALWSLLRIVTGIADAGNTVATTLTLVVAAAGFWLSLSRIDRDYRARNVVEQMV